MVWGSTEFASKAVVALCLFYSHLKMVLAALDSQYCIRVDCL